MATLLKSKSYNYSDVNLIGQPGKVESRKSIPIEFNRIVVSGMTSIIGPTFIRAVAKLPKEMQPTLHIPRDIFWKENLTLCKNLGLENIFVGVGLNTPKIEDLAKELGYNTLLLDVANGYLPQVKRKCLELSKLGFKVIAGSVHTIQGVLDLAESYCSIIRSGIAPGSVCTTKDATGFTRGTFTEIYEMASTIDRIGISLLADGGISFPSDVSKAFLAGADYIMSGRLFVEAKECRMHQKDEERTLPDKTILPKGVYFGMASHFGKMCMSLDNSKKDFIEGKVDSISYKELTLEEVISTIWGGIASAVSYSGYKTLTEAIGNGTFEIKG